MKRVEKIFLQQANLTFFEKNTQIFDVNVNDRDLGDPLIPDRIIQPENIRLGDYIFVRRSPMEAISGVSFTIFFTWNLRTIAALLDREYVPLPAGRKPCGRVP